MNNLIISAAIRMNETGVIFTGHRHHNCIESAYWAHTRSTFGNSVQGFVTADGRFLNRHEAALLAFENGQIIPMPKKPPSTLFSEDLW